MLENEIRTTQELENARAEQLAVSSQEVCQRMVSELEDYKNVYLTHSSVSSEATRPPTVTTPGPPNTGLRETAAGQQSQQRRVTWH